MDKLLWTEGTWVGVLAPGGMNAAQGWVGPESTWERVATSGWSTASQSLSLSFFFSRSLACLFLWNSLDPPLLSLSHCWLSA